MGLRSVILKTSSLPAAPLSHQFHNSSIVRTITMRISVFPWLFLIVIPSMLCINLIPVHSKCVEDQRTLLLQLRNSFTFNPAISTKLVYWNETTDCCKWNGVNCDKDDHVIGLDLSYESISSGIDNTSSLFSLQFLQSLNLANNNLNRTQIPPSLDSLHSLTYLNLSNAGFSGQIPRFSQLTRLVTLDLSTYFFEELHPLKLGTPNLRMFLQNLTELMELHLDGVNISAHGNEWCQALSSSLPNLRVLSLSDCFLSGPIDSSLSKLQSLSEIILSRNNLATSVPEFFGEFANLTVLRLISCNLYGKFPTSIFQVPTLQTLDLYNNILLQGSLPEFPQNGSLQTLVLGYTNFSGPLPYSIGNLGMLSTIELQSCSFSGLVPNSMANLARLLYLDLSSNMFTGTIPSFRTSRNMTHIDLSRNDLMGPIPFSHFKGLLDLEYIDLRFNSFNGSIPSSLFGLPSLQKLLLANNHFDGLHADFSNASVPHLDTLDLSSNNLRGPIPFSIFELRRLNVLLLSSNNLNGSIQLEMFQRFSDLTVLDLSYNQLSVDANGSNSSFSSFPHIAALKLASCNLQSFPDLKNQSKLFYLDLSDNKIGGKIPNWIWGVGDGALVHLNLSYNLLVGLQEPFVFPSLGILDLHANHIRGKIPTLPQDITYVDYSNNNFNCSIPLDIGNNLTSAYFFSVSNNNLTGNIPESICNARYIQVLDMSKNRLSGSIPNCLTEKAETLGVLNLGKNNLSGNITGTFLTNCGLKTLDLHENFLEGEIPKSVQNCSMLEVLNLGSNQIKDTFPCFLNNSSSLRVLVLRRNMFYGGIHCPGANNSWSNLQIIDTSSNYFTGALPQEFFLTLRAMMNGVDDAQSEISHLRFEFLRLNHFYYQDTVTVTNKGLEMELVKILSVFTSIDFSNNNFEGNIPETVGDLKSLYVLNLSRNALTGTIPSSIGNLTQLGSLDLSVNQLSGKIPVELTRLTFLSAMNLSYNQLVGIIPKGTQFQTFSNTSFEGNKGLSGPPLTSDVEDNHSYPKTEINPNWTTGESNWHSATRTRINWNWIAAECGFTMGLGFVVGPLMFCKRWRKWYYKYVDHIVFRILHRQDQGRKNQRRRPRRNPIKRR
ncbi:unnamed protein product [Ilex paraguariensis]|uniref:Leucine-rich repeat-containing N-terminal plant-type domain-containing protein n=1 Tax=Ilex paraguariensis TaxID=185542 RepID=A0ABC8RZN0_9AQUA